MDSIGNTRKSSCPRQRTFHTVNLYNNNFDQSANGTNIQIPFTIDSSNLNNTDPLFVDPDNDDFHLTKDSPCIDAGTSENAPDTDIEGLSRPKGFGYDLGAHELGFVDFAASYWAYDYIYKIFYAGITTGCSQNPLKYCPYDLVTRAQMAAFIVRAVEGETDDNYCDTGSPFSDVSPDYWACKYIKRLSELEITTGCGPGIYCPNNNVTRAQMAAFLIRAVEGEPPTDYCDAGSPFTDVSPDTWPCKYIKRLSELGITKGCGGTNYCPTRNVTRTEMAAFLSRAFLEVILSDALYSPVTDHWYQLNDTRMKWSEAKAFAESRGGYLAAITSAAEGQWLYDTFGSALRIDSGMRIFGGDDVAIEEQWQWITGETWSYTNWYAGEPNDYGGNEDCVAFSSTLNPGQGHYWNDVPTDVEYRSLIEYNSNPN